LTTITFIDTWQSYFASHNLKSFDDFFSYNHGRLIDKNSRRNVTCFSLDHGTDRKTFFLKRFLRPHLKDILFTWRRFGKPCSQAQCEYLNTQLLLDNGIETYRPVCYGQQTTCGLERNSFLLTEQLPGLPLTEFVRRHFHTFSPDQKRDLLTHLAEFVKKIHSARISLPDLYLWHIFLLNPDQPHQPIFAVIDLHRMRHNPATANAYIEDLARLHHSMAASHFDPALKHHLLHVYAADLPDPDRLIQQVQKYSDRISARRRPKPY